MSYANVPPTQALSRLLAAAKQINADECKDERVFHALQGEIGVAEGVLRDYVEPEPVAYLRFRAAQSWSGSGNHDIEHNEWLETCHAHEIGDDKLPAFPVYDQPVAAQSAVAAASVPAGWCIVEKATHYALHEGNTVVASLSGPKAKENATIIANAIIFAQKEIK